MSNPTPSPVVQQLLSELDADSVSTGAERLDVLSRDVYAQGGAPLAAVRPKTVAALQAAVKLCAAAGVAMVPRGGGASYTDGYLLPAGGHVLFDTGALD